MGGCQLLQLLLALAFAGCALAQTPEWITTLDKLSLPENTPVGTTIGTLQARDPGGQQIFYFIQADMLQVNRDSGAVRLTRPVDFEDVTEKVLKVKVIAVNPLGLENSRDIEITLVDVNDETAKFSSPEYRTTIPENTPVGTTVFRAVNVSDRDLSNRILIVTCNVSAKANATAEERRLFQEACDKFQINQTTQSERSWGGHIILRAQLDYETTSSYKIPLQTFDGLNYEVGNFEVFVSDVNDSPPRFVRLQPATVQEGLPPGRPVTWVSAVDTDSTNPRNITYVFVDNPGSFFVLDYRTGNITTNTTLDRDSPQLSRGFVPLTIKAQEMIGDIPGNDPLTTVTGTIQINIEDINDNAPTFHETNFNVSIREDIANNSPLPGLIMTITDSDQGTFNSYALVLLNSTDRFAVFPEQGRERSTASIKVTNTDLIDYERGPIMYILVVEAREILTVSGNTGTATVTVHVIDVNDNNPTFAFPSNAQNYNESITELSLPGRQIVQIRATDPDTGTMGTAGIRYGLVGNGAEKFRIDPQTGWVTVGPCPTQPGKPECLDYETQRRYDLTATATDENGANTGRTNTAPLTIHITDENDNSPTFFLPSYTEYIREGNMITVNPLIVRARDPDTVPGLGITYSLGGAESAKWIINPTTGNITARERIYYTGNGRFDFYVTATDGSNTETASVTILVIDENDKQPRFIPSAQYLETIDETTPGNTPVLTVTATDEDDPTTANGIIDFVIERGDQGLFVVNSSSGVISTTANAKFDYDKQSVYQLIVLARDRGNPQLTGTGTVTINIRDANNKFPYFVPSTQQADISEEVSIGTSVLRVSARDPDVNPTLEYYWCGPKSAINSQGVPSNNVSFVENMFAINRNTGLITTATRLDRDQAAVVTYTMCVQDTSAPATEQQIGTGTVIITVLEYNSRAPYFEQNPYNITIDEEKPLGSLVRTLVAFDDRDAIAEYRLISNPGSYFALASQTGVLTVNQRLDFEALDNPVIVLRVEAFDDGSPQRSNTTEVIINVRNINDNSPNFGVGSYVVDLEENPPNGTFVVRVSATDLDKGDYGNVFYELPQTETRFVINNITGDISVRDGRSLDRETQPTIVMQVTAYDSPLDPTVRRSYAVPLYIQLVDKNDNPPMFSQAAYYTTIIETINVGSEVLQVLASDLDIGRHALLNFQKVPGSGDPNNYFGISSLFGRITVQESLRGREGVYFFRVSATDNEGKYDPRFTSYANVTITVLEATNSPPRWVIPPSENFTIEVLESQYLGMLVYDVEAEDLDTGSNGVVDYMFYTSNGTTVVTPEFRINPITGVIRAERVYDREEVDRYVLLLLARDRGTPSLESTRYLTVLILDVNDNVPEFPMANGQTIPVNFPVSEDMAIGTVIGKVNATDRDSNVTNSRIYYYIIAGNEEGIVLLNRDTGVLTLNKALDREKNPTYSLTILATNNISDYTVRTRRRRSTDPSIVTVNINLQDVNDQPPQFTNFPEYQYASGENRYHGCVSRNAPFGRSILRVAATDPDQNGVLSISFGLQSGDQNYFGIEPRTGVVYNQFLSNLAGSVHSTRVTATDGKFNVTAPLQIFVYSADNEVKLVVKQRPAEVQVFQTQIESTLRRLQNLDYVCVSRISNHMLGDGTVDDTQTDLYLSGVRLNNDRFQFYSGAELLALLQPEVASNSSLLSGLNIATVASTEQQESVIDYKSVLAVLIIIILLIILFIVLICVACILIKNSKRRKFRRMTARSVRPPAPQPYEPSFQEAKGEPLHFENAGFEPEPPGAQYAVVKKTRPPMDMAPVAPVVIPAELEEPEPVIVTEVENVQAAPPSRPDSYPGSYPGSDHSDDDDDEPVIVTEVEPGPAESPRSSRRSSRPSSRPSTPHSQQPSEPDDDEFRIVTEVM